MVQSLRHCIESQQFDREQLKGIFRLADKMRQTPSRKMRSRILAAIFYEPSTRTRLSFETAALRLGGHVVGTENAGVFSSAIKGETLEDSIKVISSYCDIIIIRHNEDDAAERAAQVSSVPVVSAGCGKGQHPTQALLDIYTIEKRRGSIDGLHIALVGDLLNGRTAHSLAYLLGKFDDIRITFVAPPTLQIPPGIREYLTRHNVQYEEIESLQNVIGTVDAVYTTRVQRERMNSPSGPAFARLEAQYRIDAEMASRMKDGAFIMHPLPRNSELTTDVDSLPQAAYFEQAANGLYVRMALLHTIFS